MNKKVKIVLIPSDKRTNFGLFKDIKNGEIFFTETSIKDNPYFAPQQLLVVSDDEIQINDMYYTTGSKTLEYSVFKCDTERLVKISNELNVKKIIASYPNLHGTLPISKETIQEWINLGTPEEGSVEIKKTIKHSITDKWGKLNKFVVDNQDNLILKFDKEEEKDYFDDDIYDAIIDFRKNHPEKTIIVESPIPTDEDIEEKAIVLIKSLEGENNFKDLTAFELSLCLTYFKEGYKQALKDLEHE
jgi:hypothetical protein